MDLLIDDQRFPVPVNLKLGTPLVPAHHNTQKGGKMSCPMGTGSATLFEFKVP